MYTGNPATNKIDEVRLLIGDVYPDFEILKDSDYTYFLDKYAGNANRASVDAARSIMFLLSRWTRERTGDIEVYGSEWARNYRTALLEYIKNPNMSVIIAMPWAGGISKKDMLKNDSNPDNVPTPFYIGMHKESHSYNDMPGEDSSPSFYTLV